MTKQRQLLGFIATGTGSQRTWSACREFYASISPELCRWKEGSNRTMYDQVIVLTKEQAHTLNVRGCRRAVDEALYRLSLKGLVQNPSRGIHKAS